MYKLETEAMVLAEYMGATPNSIRRANRGQALRCILTGNKNTRVDIANALQLTKTTLTNIVSDMTAGGILVESTDPASANNKLGRKSITLSLSDDAPLICGILILRNRICVLLGAMDGRIVELRTHRVEADLTVSRFKQILSDLFREVMSSADREVFAVSVVSLGPLDCERGVMLRPTDFYAEELNFNLRSFMGTLTKLPVFVTHDAAAAAMAEKLYGAAHDSNTFLYLSLEGGIGAGFYLDGRLYNGPFGQNGEIGHTSIRFDGELCKCGNRGCLELYASTRTMRRSAERFRAFIPKHDIYSGQMDIFSIIRMADSGDMLCKELLKEYCQYLAHALSNAITLLNIREIYIGTPDDAVNRTLEHTLSEILTLRLNTVVQHEVQVRHAHFGIDATLYGTIAAVMERVFEGDIFPGEQLPENI